VQLLLAAGITDFGRHIVLQSHKVAALRMYNNDSRQRAAKQIPVRPPTCPDYQQLAALTASLQTSLQPLY